MSFLDYVLASFGVFEVKDTPEKRPKKLVTPHHEKPQSLTKENTFSKTFSKSSNQMAIFCPTNTNQVVQTAKFLANNQPMMVDFSCLPKALLQRSIDFLSGAKTALGATLKIMENGLFVFVPKGTEFIEFLGDTQ